MGSTYVFLSFTIVGLPTATSNQSSASTFISIIGLRRVVAHAAATRSRIGLLHSTATLTLPPALNADPFYLACLAVPFRPFCIPFFASAFDSGYIGGR